MALCYILAFCLFLQQDLSTAFFQMLAAPGRMALSCYILQSLIGIFLFYGVGLGLGTSVGLVFVVLIAFGVFLLEMVLCHVWLRSFRFGPLEWVWRLLTYGQYFPIRKKQ